MTKDIMKNTLIVCAYVLLMVLFFFGGYAMGGARREKTTVAVSATPEPVTVPAAVAGPQKSRYELVLENSELFLYKRDGESSELLYSHPIIETVFPREDVEELRNGVWFDSLDDAQSLLENFVS